MRFEAHAYQEHTIRWMLERPASALFLDMGMGKTVCTLTAVKSLLYEYFEVYRVLVIAPLRVAKYTWSAEADKWDHLRSLRIAKVLGTERQRVMALNADADIYIINRENVAWLVDLYGDAWPFDMVVIDELSSFKSGKSRRFRALRKILPYVDRIVGLTGTPTPNGLIDLWSQIYLLDRGTRLGRTVSGYRERYFTPDARNGHVVYSWKIRPRSEEAIYAKISDICVSMSAGDYLDLPDRIDVTHSVILPEDAEFVCAKLEKEFLLEFDDAYVSAPSAAVLAGKLLQIANGAVYDEYGHVQVIHDAKLDALEDVIEAANGQNILVYYAYQHDRDRIKKRFHTAKDLDIAAWNAGEIPLMLAHPASAGHGLNLQDGGRIVVWFGLTWSLELYQQANARLYRQGQTHPVTVVHLTATGTIDEQVIKALQEKRKTQDALIDAVKARFKNI